MKLFVWISLFIFACSPLDPYENQINPKSSSQIINGILVSAEDPIATHVVLVHDFKNGYVCTGALVGSNTVLTAAHCLVSKRAEFEIIFSRSAFDALDKRDASKIRKANKIVIHEKYESNDEKAPVSDQSDIGLIYFTGSLPAGYRVANVLLEDELKKDRDVVVAGFGVSKLNYSEVKFKTAQRFKNKVKSGQIICNHNSFDEDGDPFCIEIEMNDDGLLRKTTTKIKYTTPTEFVLDEKTTGSCSGDSGGPVFIEKEGQVHVVGVTSRGDLLCDSDGVYTSIAPYVDWLITH